MTTPTLEEFVTPQKELVLARQATHDEATRRVSDLRAIVREENPPASAARQLEDALFAQDITREDLEAAQAELKAAYAAGRRVILERERPGLVADVEALNKAFGAFVRAVQRVDERRETLIVKLEGASELVPIVSPLPYAAERQEYWRAAMSSEHLL